MTSEEQAREVFRHGLERCRASFLTLTDALEKLRRGERPIASHHDGLSSKIRLDFEGGLLAFIDAIDLIAASREDFDLIRNAVLQLAPRDQQEQPAA